MSRVEFHKQIIFRETPDVIFSDITVTDSNATDLVIHDGPAVSPPDDSVGSNSFTFTSIKLTTIVWFMAPESLKL